MACEPLIPVGDAAPAKAKRRKPLATTALTRRFYEARGWRVAFVERCVRREIPGVRFPLIKKFDAWGFADHLMFLPGQPGMRAVNSCGMTGGSLAEHVTKILANPLAWDFLQDPNNRIGVMGWKRGARGKSATYKYRAITLEMFADGRPPEPEKKPRARQAQQSVKCHCCGIIKTDQVAWSDGDVCWVCKAKDEQPPLWRQEQAETINRGTDSPVPPLPGVRRRKAARARHVPPMLSDDSSGPATPDLGCAGDSPRTGIGVLPGDGDCHGEDG